MVIAQGDVYWADLPVPRGSEPGFRRPVVVVQGDTFNQSQIGTVLCVPCSGNVKRADYPGQVLLRARSTGLPHDSVASLFHLTPVNKSDLLDRAGHLGRAELHQLLSTLDVVLDR
jgi:mRNA interferase MazF